MIVVDASALVDLLAGTRRAAGVRRHLAEAGQAAAPDLLHVEVASALWRLERAGTLTSVESAAAVDALVVMPLTAVPAGALVRAAWALRESVRVADAFYLACARALDVPLLTTDARLARGHHGVSVTLVG